MIQYLNNKRTSVVTYVLIALVAIPFVFFGATSFFNNSSRVIDVAEVDGKAVSSYKYYRALRDRQDQLLEQYGDSITEDNVSEEIIGPVVMRELLQKEAVSNSLLKGGMGIDYDIIKKQIVLMQQFQLDGQFSPEIYRDNLNSIGFTSLTFIEELEDSEINREFRNAIVSSTFIDSKSFDNYIKILGETRSYDYIKLGLENELAKTDVSSQEIEDYYRANQQQFEVDDQVAVEYVTLDFDALREAMLVTETAIKERYELLKSEPITQNSEVAHILVEDRADGSHRQILQEVQEKLSAGEDFSALALQYSDDFGSKEAGGNLGFTNGDAFPQKFEEAIATLQTEGETSGVIRTDSGNHIIKLLSRSGSVLADLEQERERITGAVKNEMAESRFNELVDRMNEIAFPAQDLQPLLNITTEVTLTIVTSDLFTKAGSAGDFIAQHQTLVAAAYSDNVVNQKRNSEVVIVDSSELGPKSAIVLRIAEFKPKHIPELEKVKDTITATVKQEKANKSLYSYSQNLFKIVKAGTPVEEIAKKENLNWQVRLDVLRSDPYEPTPTLFTVESTKVPYNKIIQDYDGNYYIVHVTEVNIGGSTKYTEEQKQSFALQYEQIQSGLELRAIGMYIYNNTDIQTSFPVSNR